MANTFRNEIYRPAKALSYIAMAGFGVLALCAFFFIISSFVIIFFPDANIDADGGESMNIGVVLLGLAAILEIPTRILTIIFFLIWEYRAFNNLSVLRARNLEFSPGWAVGWWFIPFANLVKPFQVMRELYNESDPDFDEEAGFLSSVGSSAPELMTFWWAFFLISNIIYRISDAIINSSNDFSSPAFLGTFIVASILHIAGAVCAIILVKKITERQEKRFARLSVTQMFEPPPPPTFEDA